MDGFAFADEPSVPEQSEAEGKRPQAALPMGPLPLGRLSDKSAAALERSKNAAELLTMHRQRDAAWLARDTAEIARSRAEGERKDAEQRNELARETVMRLEEQIVFLEEQLRSNRQYATEIVERRMGELNLDRAALLKEVAVLNEELQNRASNDR